MPLLRSFNQLYYSGCNLPYGCLPALDKASKILMYLRKGYRRIPRAGKEFHQAFLWDTLACNTNITIAVADGYQAIFTKVLQNLVRRSL
jgi:hypothetical protein